MIKINSAESPFHQSSLTEPLKKNFSLALGLGRIEFCEFLHGGDVTLFRDSLRQEPQRSIEKG
jgi:hypothetical protein